MRRGGVSGGDDRGLGQASRNPDFFVMWRCGVEGARFTKTIGSRSASRAMAVLAFVRIIIMAMVMVVIVAVVQVRKMRVVMA